MLPGPDGSPVPAVTLDGEPISLAGLRGKVVWVDFWASWCPPCRAETPVLRDLYARHRDDGFAMVGVSVQEGSADDVRRYVDAYAIAYPIVADLTGSIFREWRVYGLPTQFLLDRDGAIRAIVQGPVDAETGESLVAPLLAERSTGPAASGAPGAAPTAP
jgi:thiol-disulfide isomerase/thioredoxin